LCVHHARESHHVAAQALFDAAPRLLTHNYVLAEFVALAHSRGLPRRPFLTFLIELIRLSDVEVVWVMQNLHEAATDLLEHRPDKTYSLCDAVSFVLMRQRGITEALTTDRHFEQEGFRRLLG
jgi:predicted nucleic acid-binding protein